MIIKIQDHKNSAVSITSNTKKTGNTRKRFIQTSQESDVKERVPNLYKEIKHFLKRKVVGKQAPFFDVSQLCI